MEEGRAESSREERKTARSGIQKERGRNGKSGRKLRRSGKGESPKKGEVREDYCYHWQDRSHVGKGREDETIDISPSKVRMMRN